MELFTASRSGRSVRTLDHLNPDDCSCKPTYIRDCDALASDILLF